MGNTKEVSDQKGPDFFLDITGEVCPMTFVRTKLLVERMTSGQTAEIRLKGAEPLSNVPRAVVAEGHAVLSFAPEDASRDPTSVHRLVIRKG